MLPEQGRGWLVYGRFFPQSRCLGDEELTVSKLPCFSFHACDDPILSLLRIVERARHRSDPFFMGEVGNAHEIRLSRERDDAVAEDGYFVAVIERGRVDRAAISLSPFGM